MRARPQGVVRIIGGQWRGRRLPVPDLPGLRPSGDRARETLFNWLAPWIPGARCLDLFAGTGALGFEALSRGAGSCVLLENQRSAVQVLRESAIALNAAERAQIIETNALTWMAGCSDQFDIVFVDPPYADNQWQSVLSALPDLLTEKARVYCESPADPGAAFQPGVIAGLVLEKRKTVGAVEMRLFQRAPNR